MDLGGRRWTLSRYRGESLYLSDQSEQRADRDHRPSRPARVVVSFRRRRRTLPGPVRPASRHCRGLQGERVRRREPGEADFRSSRSRSDGRNDQESKDDKTILAPAFCQVAWVVRDIAAAETFFVDTMGISRFLHMDNLAAKDTRALSSGSPGTGSAICISPTRAIP